MKLIDKEREMHEITPDDLPVGDQGWLDEEDAAQKEGIEDDKVEVTLNISDLSEEERRRLAKAMEKALVEVCDTANMSEKRRKKERQLRANARYLKAFSDRCHYMPNTDFQGMAAGIELALHMLDLWELPDEEEAGA